MKVFMKIFKFHEKLKEDDFTNVLAPNLYFPASVNDKPRIMNNIQNLLYCRHSTNGFFFCCWYIQLIIQYVKWEICVTLSMVAKEVWAKN